jgi:hypothetical protein
MTALKYLVLALLLVSSAWAEVGGRDLIPSFDGFVEGSSSGSDEVLPELPAQVMTTPQGPEARIQGIGTEKLDPEPKIDLVDKKSMLPHESLSQSIPAEKILSGRMQSVTRNKSNLPGYLGAGLGVAIGAYGGVLLSSAAFSASGVAAAGLYAATAFTVGIPVVTAIGVGAIGWWAANKLLN